MSTLALTGIEVPISDARASYNKLRLKYQRLAEQAAVNFSNNFSTQFKSIDDIHNGCTDAVMPIMREVAEVAVADLVAQGYYDIDIDAFGEYFAPYFKWDEDFAAIDDKYMEIVLKGEERDAYRTQCRESRSRWAGGGIGISGAFKGASQAAALNLATGAVHGLFNGAAKAISAVGDTIEKGKLYNDPATKQALVNALYRAIFSMHFAYIDAVNDKKLESYTGFVTTDDETKASRLLQNVEAGRVPKEAIKEVMLDALQLDPYNEGFFQLWLGEFGDQNGELEKLESYFGVSVVSSTKRDLIQAHKASLDFSTPEACDAGLAALSKYSATIGYQEFTKERQAILALKAAREQEKRTVAGVAYTSDSAAEEAKDELARTVRGVTHSTHEAAELARSQKVVGVWFYLALFFFPQITPFFTLRKGYSTTVRIISFAWLAVFIAFFIGVGRK